GVSPPPPSTAKGSKASRASAKTSSRPTPIRRPSAGPLVGVDWLADHVDDPDLRLVHVSDVRRVYNKGHIATAVYSDLHRDLALRGAAPETGAAVRESLVPTREATEAALRRWRVGDGDRIVFMDDVGLNRHAARGYWLMRLYGVPSDRIHVLDGGIEAWRRAGQPLTADVPEADLADGLRQPMRLAELDATLLATYEEVLGWSGESTARPGAPTRLLDVRTAAEWVGEDLRARRGGHIPGARQRAYEDLLCADGTFRSLEAMLSLIKAGGAEPAEIRATYCQSGVRAALVWFVLSELAGHTMVKNYAGSWEDWGNRDDSPVEAP
ncbi:MAG: rhodanese-like domain-containing protein, partial [Candidatus Limnocylindrales bacterium]